MGTELLVRKLSELTTLIEQMYLAHRVEDEKMFKKVHTDASKLGFELLQTLELEIENANSR